MIASLISYEAERKTVGKLVAQNTERQDKGYFTPNSKRFPVARLRFNVTENEPRAMSLFCLLYPSETLASIYDPIECLNAGKLIKNIEGDIRQSHLPSKIPDILTTVLEELLILVHQMLLEPFE